MKKIKILMIGLSDNLGGIETYLINIYRKINKEKFDVKFLVFKNIIPCFFEEVKEDLIYITSRKENYKLFRTELKELLKENDFDYIHCNLMSYSLYEPIYFGLKYSKSKIILHSHVSGKMKNSIKTEMISKFAKNKILKDKYSKRYIFFGCSQNAIDDLFGNYYKKNNCIYFVANNGIDVNQFTYSEITRKKIRSELKISKEEILIGHVGRFTYAKNHTKLLSIFDTLVKKYPNENYKLILIGDGELKQDILLQLNKNKLLDRTILLSNISNVGEYLSAMDCFVFPSIFEGLGIAVIEAQISGLPCIISDNIPNEIDVTNNIFRCNINETDDNWIAKIVGNVNKRKRNVDVNSFYEYESSNSVLKIEKIYSENIEGGNR